MKMVPNGAPRNESMEIVKRLGLIFLLVSLLITGIRPTPSAASPSQHCIDCHGSFGDVHGTVQHDASPGSGGVALFPNNGHDDAGWYGTLPYFEVIVDCGICHNNDLPVIHGNNCATCHTSPYDTLDKAWNGGCQQGGCHITLHEDSTTAHAPFEDSSNSGDNDCSICHLSSFEVVQSQCLNCHAPFSPGDVTPPITTSNAQSTYYGPAAIEFSITESGKVGIGTTFFRLDGGPEASGSKLVVSGPGSHTVEFWSVDQSGNVESPSHHVSFSIIEDTTPPTTTSNAQDTYSNGGLITLTATDDSAAGVKNTYYSLNDGPVQTGTSITIPATSEIIEYTLIFWSEDWAGNLEGQNSVTFSTTGSGTIRLVWGSSDINVNSRPSSSDRASWYIYEGSWSGPLIARGSAGGAGWSGVNDVSVPLSSTSYFVRVDWYWSEEDWSDQSTFTNVYVTTPGQIVRLSY